MNNQTILFIVIGITALYTYFTVKYYEPAFIVGIMIFLVASIPLSMWLAERE